MSLHAVIADGRRYASRCFMRFNHFLIRFVIGGQSPDFWINGHPKAKIVPIVQSTHNLNDKR